MAVSEFRRPVCIPELALQSRVPARTQHYALSVSSRLRVLTIATWIAAAVSGGFGIFQLTLGGQIWRFGFINLASAALFLMVPLLYRFGELIAPLAFFVVAYVSVAFMCFEIGTGSGLQFYLLVSATLVVLVLGIERIVLAGTLAAMGVAAIIALELLVPNDRGLGPSWTLTVGFVSSAISSAVMMFATVWYSLRETARAEQAMEAEYQRSEQLLANILPATIAARLKDPARTIIADKYDDASILFADIAGYTERASDTTPTDLVRFLDQLYTDLDALVDKHGLEKVKTSGDSYMVVSGVPRPRADHVEALACLALDMADAVADLKDPQGRAVPLRIGLASGPVVAGVVGARKFFYDVWGDAVNVASRMETTDVAGRIQVPQNVYDRIRQTFLLEERGEIDIKGKGLMRTWYLVGRRDDAVRDSLEIGSQT
ncbi:adenylate cyclase [Mycolicibacterium mageritense DSM 44476 = CIP 104973]|uniref:Adenylate cyclase n=1 Tax=Mycolicibacterium mageritense TaxID=53462 RepID=A0AAI8XNM3_MYCME|nr:adenylate/guanylate cyclase domain-containing protein [Mycolicibacterium mageritense]MBN3454391.1 adenylate/guanylate cyclase domain-containing protein [Mycobacterium sp. DSM 3803]OKH70698.1 adenylate cyclase [Mycobacterium sp. SWH-M3]CDO26623.1 adenylate cyclase [Mycolicibacterium mageritense DSM 44476 = CIP 104973]BBX36994.1 adenylate cyclase [Mycolicibacterium mageritense]BDY31839.1 Adenylate cyclase [Mycolicibacterium mageritense]